MSEGLRNEPTLQGLPGEAGPPTEPAYDQAPARGRASRRSRRRRVLRVTLAILVVALAVAAIVSILWRPRLVEVEPATVPAAPRVGADAPQPPRYPIEPVAAALPPLDGSDAALIAALQALWSDGGGIVSYLEPRDLVRNFVTTVDNIPRRTIAVQRVPLKPPAGTFVASRANGSITTDAANDLRYRPYVLLLSTVDTTKLAQFYVRHYPLFQQAYRDLGYPNGHFNDRLVESIDVVLATPDQRSALKLVQPKIFFEYADRDLEKLPAGQKLLLRMGPDNAAAVKKKLIELRALVTAAPAAQAQAAPATAPANPAR